MSLIGFKDVDSSSSKKFKVSDKKFFKKPKGINLQKGSTKDAFFGDGSFRNAKDSFDELVTDFEN